MQFLGEYDNPLSPSATTTAVLVHHPGVHCILPPPPHDSAFLLLLLQLSHPPQSFQLDGCKRRLWMMEPDTGGVEDGRLRATLDCVAMGMLHHGGRKAAACG
jgi:hypothetical protein